MSSLCDQQAGRTILKKKIDIQVMESQENQGSKMRALAEPKSSESSSITYFKFQELGFVEVPPRCFPKNYSAFRIGLSS